MRVREDASRAANDAWLSPFHIELEEVTFQPRDPLVQANGLNRFINVSRRHWSL